MAGRTAMAGRHMAPNGAVRALARAILVGIACLLAGPIAARAADSPRGAARSAVRLQLSVGYQNIFRGGAWTPVRVAVRNGGSTDLKGTVELPQAPASATGAQPTFHGLSEAPVIVPAGAMKNVTVGVPGCGSQGRGRARFLG